MDGDGKSYGYKGSYFHHVTADTDLKGGRMGGKLVQNSMGGKMLPLTGPDAGTNASAFGGRPFRDENFKLDHGPFYDSTRALPFCVAAFVVPDSYSPRRLFLHV